MKPSQRVTFALAALDGARLRKTPQRLAIVHAFVDDETHPTAQQIFDRLRRKMPTMSFATVYNTLATLERAGSCRMLRIDGKAGDAGSRFDPNIEAHDHAVCDRCGAVRDVPRAAKEEGSSKIAGFRVHSVETLYRGKCRECSEIR